MGSDSEARQDVDLTFYLNGKFQTLRFIDPETTILEYVRKLGLTGTKLVCGEGGCGACTVLLSRKNAAGELVHRPVNACVANIADAHGAHITTVEGLAGVGGAKTTTQQTDLSDRSCLHPVQRALAEAHGSQCGYCTPGFVMSMYGLLVEKEQKRTPCKPRDIEDALDGNLCRCTGYRPIYQGFERKFCSNPDRSGDTGSSGWSKQETNNSTVGKNKPRPASSLRYEEYMRTQLKPPQEIAPFTLRGRHTGKTCRFHQPRLLPDLLRILADSENFRLQVGATERMWSG